MTKRKEVERLDYSKPPPGYRHEGWDVRTQRSRDATWAHYKRHNDPPGMRCEGVEGDCGVQWWSFRLAGFDRDFITGGFVRIEYARDAAWSYHDRRHALPWGDWPECLSWSDAYVAEVERWMVDSTAEMPEVLRG